MTTRIPWTVHNPTFLSREIRYGNLVNHRNLKSSIIYDPDSEEWSLMMSDDNGELFLRHYPTLQKAKDAEAYKQSKWIENGRLK